jgi:hypothetical protein
MDQILRNFAGATVRRVIDRSFGIVPEHAHDWPVLSIFVLGSYINKTELGLSHIHGPSVVLYRRGTVHQNTIGPSGFEQIEIEIDADWLGELVISDQPVTRFPRAFAAAAAPALVRACIAESDEEAAHIAASAGFCDQSHMIRTFNRILGRLPSAVRADRAFMRRSALIHPIQTSVNI